MLTRSKVLVLVAGISGLMALLAPVAHAITISVAEVRDGAAFVKGSDAGRKQEIFWLEEYVTTANGKSTSVSKESCPRVVLRSSASGR